METENKCGAFMCPVVQTEIARSVGKIIDEEIIKKLIELLGNANANRE